MWTPFLQDHRSKIPLYFQEALHCIIPPISELYEAEATGIS